MQALIVYESMFGNTHEVADHLAIGLGAEFDVVVAPVDDVDPEALAATDLLIVGGPTHVHGMTSSMTRKAAAQQAEGDNELEMEPGAEDREGLKEWLHDLTTRRGASAAAFDTRIDSPAALTGRASKGIARRLRKHGYELVAGPESFLVNSDNHLLAGESERAEAWGRELADAVRREHREARA